MWIRPLCSLDKEWQWGVFQRPLEVRFGRRAPLISEAVRLNGRIGTELRQVAGASEIQPRMWASTPNSGSQGGATDFLDTSEHAPAASVSRCARRDELKRGIEGAGLARPGESARKDALRAGTGVGGQIGAGGVVCSLAVGSERRWCTKVSPSVS